MLTQIDTRAHVQVQESSKQSRYYEFPGLEPRLVINAQKKCEQLRADVLRHCQESNLGDHAHVNVVEDDGFYIFRIQRTDRMKKPLAVRQLVMLVALPKVNRITQPSFRM